MLSFRQSSILFSMPSRLSMFGSTYTRELDAAVTALRGGTPLLDVKVPVLATGGPDNADLVGDRVVPGCAYVSLQFLSSSAVRGPGNSMFECAFFRRYVRIFGGAILLTAGGA